MVPPQPPVVPEFDGVTAFYIGADRYTLRYSPQPGRNYDSIRSSFGNKPLTVVVRESTGKKKKKKKMTRDAYVRLMKRFGEANGFRAMASKTFIGEGEDEQDHAKDVRRGRELVEAVGRSLHTQSL